MFQDILTSLFALLVVEPIQSDLNAKLGGAGLPAAVVSEAQACAAGAAPALAARAWNDPWWGVTTAFSVAVGTQEPIAVLGAASPACASALGQIAPLLRDGAA